MGMQWPEGKRPVFVGAGWTMIRRYMPRTISSNAKEAATMAIKDAGLEIEDIDGIFIWANPNWGSGGPDPKVWLDVNHMMQVMPWKNIKFWLQPEAVAAGSCGGVQTAALALGAGVVNYALIVRTGHHPAGVRYRQISTNRAPGNAAFTTPYGHGVGGSGQAVTYQRYLAKYGAKREQMWGYVGTAHDNAQLSPPAVWRGREITEEDGRPHVVLTGDYTGWLKGWEPSALAPGQKLREPKPLFRKLDPETVVAEELARMRAAGLAAALAGGAALRAGLGAVFELLGLALMYVF